METKMLERQNRILRQLSQLPRMMMLMDGRDNISEFIFHELCSQSCLNLRKAAYLVDNPDFNCLRGVVGFDSNEVFSEAESIWKKPDEFSKHMQLATFNNQVRSIYDQSLKGQESNLAQMAKKLGFGSSSSHVWNMRHDNNGILMYEKTDPEDVLADNHILDGMSLLSFCPIF